MTNNHQIEQSRADILIVDDMLPNLRLLSTMLLKQGYKVRSVPNGSMALSTIKVSEPHLILLDINMPEMNGLEVCQRLKADETTRDIPIIFISAMDEMFDKARAFAVGGVDYITKPFQIEEVLLRVDTHLTLRNLQKKLQLKNSQLQQEITEHERAKTQLQHMALHDTLTNLPNRAFFMEYLEQAFERSQRHQDYLFAVLFIDLDRFKHINDTLGHEIGDQTLIAVSRRLERCIRSSDMVARLGGDEFTILLSGIQKPQEAQDVADRIQQELTLPIDLEKHQIFANASIGITINTRAYKHSEDILRDADMAMYRAKSQGEDRGLARSELFKTQQHIQIVNQRQLEIDLWQAVSQQEFRLDYQPIVSLTTGQINGVEVILGWQHPRQGLLSADKFMPLAEKTGLIVPLGQWVLRAACSQIQEWHEFGHPTLRLIINILPRQLQQQDLPQMIQDVLQESNLGTQSLTLAITPSAVSKAVDDDWSVLQTLSAIGLPLTLLGFGVNSTLLSFTHFPFAALKLDPALLTNLHTKTGQEVIAAIIVMAHRLKLRIIAAGVETTDQAIFLRSQQCHEAQGYLFSQPVPAEALTLLLQDGFQPNTS